MKTCRSARLSATLAGGRSVLISRFSSTSAPSSECVGRWSTICASPVQPGGRGEVRARRACAARPTCRRRAAARRRRGRRRRPESFGRSERSGRSAGWPAPTFGGDVASPAPRREQTASASASVGGVRAQPREERAEDARAGLGVGERAVRDLDLDAERLPRAARACAGRASGAKRRASATVQSTGGSGHSQPARSNAWRSTRRSKLAECATSTRPVEHARELRQHALRRRRVGDHHLRDPGEALDAARQRPAHATSDSTALVQLAAADEHRADLGQLARLARDARWSPCRRRGTRRCAAPPRRDP